MASISMEGPSSKNDSKVQHSIVDDFMYGSNVATAHVYIRMGFLRKVYGIVSTQLLLTFLVGALFISVESVKTFVQTSSWLLLVAFIGTIGLIIGLVVKRHETPINYILLFAFTLFEAYSVGVVVTFYDVSIVLQALFLTAAVTIGLTIYTLQSKRDFSSWGASLFAVLWVLILAGFLQIFFRSEMLELAMAVGGAILFSLFIVYDTHMLMHKLSPEEYVLAAINIYLDIINLFLYILRILAEMNKRN